jgi:hypothetical protein
MTINNEQELVVALKRQNIIGNNLADLTYLAEKLQEELFQLEDAIKTYKEEQDALDQ